MDPSYSKEVVINPDAYNEDDLRETTKDGPSLTVSNQDNSTRIVLLDFSYLVEGKPAGDMQMQSPICWSWVY